MSLVPFVKQLTDYKTFEHTGDWLGASDFLRKSA